MENKKSVVKVTVTKKRTFEREFDEDALKHLILQTIPESIRESATVSFGGDDWHDYSASVTWHETETAQEEL